jgi:hypothetical protein
LEAGSDNLLSGTATIFASDKGLRGFSLAHLIRLKSALSVTQKPSFEQYLLTAAGELGFENDPASAERSYKFNLRSAHQSVTSGDVISGVLAALKEMGQQYAGGNPNLLFF